MLWSWFSIHAFLSYGIPLVNASTSDMGLACLLALSLRWCSHVRPFKPQVPPVNRQRSVQVFLDHDLLPRLVQLLFRNFPCEFHSTNTCALFHVNIRGAAMKTICSRAAFWTCLGYLKQYCQYMNNLYQNKKQFSVLTVKPLSTSHKLHLWQPRLSAVRDPGFLYFRCNIKCPCAFCTPVHVASRIEYGRINQTVTVHLTFIIWTLLCCHLFLEMHLVSL